MNVSFTSRSARLVHDHCMTLDFGYPWWLSYGHLAILVPALVALLLAASRRWPRWSVVLLALISVWSAAAFLSIRFGLNANGKAELPTQSFLASGSGRVLDLGAGTGRSSIMVLESRPQATVVALDLFGESFDHHFGPGETPQSRLVRNLQAAGVESRAAIQAADMRQLPFGAASFDAIVSAYAIDHLNRDGIAKTLAEAARVLKPGGQMLLMLVHNDAWVKFAFGPLLSHGGTRPASWWTARIQEAGFEINETGTRPATLYLLATRKPLD